MVLILKSVYINFFVSAVFLSVSDARMKLIIKKEVVHLKGHSVANLIVFSKEKNVFYD